MIKSADITLSVSRNAGGLFDAIRRLLQSLAPNGMDVRVMGVQDEFTEADLSAWSPVRVSAFKPTWPKSFGYSPRYLEELLQFEPNLIHTHGLWVYSSVAASVYGRKRKTPYLISPHGMLDTWALRNSRWKKTIAYWLYEDVHISHARCIRALCETEAAAIKKMGGKNRIAIIPNGIDLPIGRPRSVPIWGGIVEPGKKVLLFLSRIHPKKGLVNLLKAWAANRGSSEWVLAIAGWDQGGHEKELMNLATELKLSWVDAGKTIHESNQASFNRGSPSVVFLGPQFNDAKAACYHFCDAFILPSFSEGVPMVVLEAWANSKPVIMTPQCNLPQGFSTEAALQIVPTVDGIAKGLNELFQMTDAQRKSMGEQGFSLVRESFTWSRVADQMKELYLWVLGGGPEPACLLG